MKTTKDNEPGVPTIRVTIDDVFQSQTLAQATTRANALIDGMTYRKALDLFDHYFINELRGDTSIESEVTETHKYTMRGRILGRWQRYRVRTYYLCALVDANNTVASRAAADGLTISPDKIEVWLMNEHNRKYDL